MKKMKWKIVDYALERKRYLINETGRIVGLIENNLCLDSFWSAFAVSAQHVTPYIIGEFADERSAKKAVENAVAKLAEHGGDHDE